MYQQFNPNNNSSHGCWQLDEANSFCTSSQNSKHNLKAPVCNSNYRHGGDVTYATTSYMRDTNSYNGTTDMFDCNDTRAPPITSSYQGFDRAGRSSNEHSSFGNPMCTKSTNHHNKKDEYDSYKRLPKSPMNRSRRSVSPRYRHRKRSRSISRERQPSKKSRRESPKTRNNRNYGHRSNSPKYSSKQTVFPEKRNPKLSVDQSTTFNSRRSTITSSSLGFNKQRFSPGGRSSKSLKDNGLQVQRSPTTFKRSANTYCRLPFKTQINQSRPKR